MKVVALFIYPIKSCQGISVNSANVTLKGLKHPLYAQGGDRQFLLVDEKGKFLTQRQYPQMATIKVELRENSLYLSCENKNISPFELIPTDDITDDNIEKKVTIWQDKTIAINQGEGVARWFKEALNLDNNCYLVKQSNQYIRPINPKYSLRENQPVSFADGFPFLVTNTASLTELNRRLTIKYPNKLMSFPMINFRPNIVIETSNPFEEDSWQIIEINQLKFHLVKPCTRCTITTTDQKTGVKNPETEPLLTLAEFRQKPKGIMFGQNAIASDEGMIKIGDLLKINSNNISG